MEWGFFDVVHTADEIVQLFANDSEWGTQFRVWQVEARNSSSTTSRKQACFTASKAPTRAGTARVSQNQSD